MKKTILSLLVVSMLPLAYAAAQSNNDRPAALPPTRAAIEQLDKRIPALMKESDVPGLSVALIRGGRLVWHHHYGVANADTKEPVSDETIFEAASLSKAVTAYTFFKLVDAGKIDPDTPLNKYLGNNYDVPADDRINLITARRVLSHSAGFPNWRPENSPTLPILFNPREKFSYSGEGFVYLAKVMEHITNMKFEDLVKQQVFDPLQMNHSSFIWLDAYKKLQVFRHDWLGNVSFRPEFPGSNAAASLHTTIVDYSKFVIALLNGSGLKKQSWQAMFTPQIKVNEETYPELAWGMGVGLEVTQQGKYFWHWGDQGDSKCYVTAAIKEKAAVLWFTNSYNGLSFTQEVLAKAIGGNHEAPEWLHYEKNDPYAKTLLQSITANGAEAALIQYREQRSQPGGHSLAESYINRLGYQLLRTKKVDDAIAVFKQNTDDFPQSYNTWDSLAEAYMTKGDKEIAIQYYEKSLQLDPNNTNAVEQLKKLKS